MKFVLHYAAASPPSSATTLVSVYIITLLHPFSGFFSRTTWVSRYQKGKTNLDLDKARDDGVMGWQWHQLDNMQTICTSLQTDNYANNISSLNFYRPDALRDAQPTASVSSHSRLNGGQCDVSRSRL